MAVIEHFEKKYNSPNKDFFKSFLSSIANGTYTPYNNGAANKDFSYMFVEKLKKSVPDIMQVFGISAPYLENSETTLDDSDVFPITTIKTTFSSQNAVCLIIFDRMDNGHLGC